MKIALIHYSAPPAVGGVESVIAHHARLMTGAGHAVSILAGSGQVFDRRIDVVTIPFLSSRNSTVLDIKKQLDEGDVPATFPALVKEIKNRLSNALEHFDVIIAHNVCSLHLNLGLTAALYEIIHNAAGQRWILWHHDLAWTSEQYQGELHSSYPWDLLRTAWPGVENVTVSELRHRQLAALYNIPPDQISVIANGVDVPGILKLGTVARKLTKELDLLAAAPLLFLPVRITRRKNIELALLTLKELRKTMPAAKLVITGPWDTHNPANHQYFEELKALRNALGLQSAAFFLAEHSVRLLPDEVIHDLFRVADALFLPSKEEGFGIPVLEAGLIGRPIFSSNIEPLTALAGMFANYFSLEDQPDAIASLVHKALSRDLAYQMRARIKQRFTWEAIFANQIAALIEGRHVS